MSVTLDCSKVDAQTDEKFKVDIVGSPAPGSFTIV
jgi:hypothetical protein